MPSTAGSGPIVISQACEFDYSGTQACKALKEEGFIKNFKVVTDDRQHEMLRIFLKYDAIFSAKPFKLSYDIFNKDRIYQDTSYFQ
jgi:ribosomal protein S8